jgi:hypothetical protein
MPLIGLVTGLIATLIADLRGNDETRPFTRRAFLVVVAVEAGIDIAAIGGVMQAIGGIL